MKTKVVKITDKPTSEASSESPSEVRWIESPDLSDTLKLKAVKQELREARELLDDALTGIEGLVRFLDRTDNDQLGYVSGLLRTFQESIEENVRLQDGRLHFSLREAETAYHWKFQREVEA